ncbi:MAG TPA: hypothetical protein PLT50_02530 [bacterium]|nr:hypothetical protein [bacterium]
MLNFPAYLTLDYIVPLGFVIFVVLFIVFLILSVVFVRMLTEASSLKEETARMYSEAGFIIKEARNQAFSLISDANKDAEKILEDASYLSQEVSQRIDSHLEEVVREGSDFVEESTENLLKAHRKALLEASKGNVSSIRKVSDEFRNELLGEISEFRKGLDAISTEARKKMEAELQRHRLSRIRDIDNTVYEIVKDASSKIIGKCLSLQDHEDFIIKVLDDAKKKGEFETL